MQEDIIRSALELYMTYRDLRNEEDQTDTYYGMTIMSAHFKELSEGSRVIWANRDKTEALAQGLIPMMSMLSTADIAEFQVRDHVSSNSNLVRL